MVLILFLLQLPQRVAEEVALPLQPLTQQRQVVRAVAQETTQVRVLLVLELRIKVLLAGARVVLLLLITLRVVAVVREQSV